MVALLDHSEGLYLPEEVGHVDGVDPGPQGSVHCLLQVSVRALDELVPDPDLVSLVGSSDITVPLHSKLLEVFLAAPPTEYRSGDFLHVDLLVTTTRPTTPASMYPMAQQVSVKHFEGIIDLQGWGIVWGSPHSIGAVWVGAGQLDAHLSDEDVPEVDLLLHLHLVLPHGLVDLYLVAALQRGQRLNQGFLLLHSEVVLLRVGDGPDPRHHGLNELVPGTALQLGQQLNQGFLVWAA